MLKTRLCNAALVLLLATGAAHASPVPDYPFVHVTGSAFQAVVPDIGSLDFEIVAVDVDPAAARAVLETRVGEVRALMQQLGMDADDAHVREVRQGIRKDDRAANGCWRSRRSSCASPSTSSSAWKMPPGAHADGAIP